MLLIETPRDLQPILSLNIITRSKRYSLFPILSGLVEPSLRNFRISLSNGLFSPVGIGESIPSLRTVLESFLSHTAQYSILVVSYFFNLPYLSEWDLSYMYPPPLFFFLGLTKRNQFHEFQTLILINNPFFFLVLSFLPPSEKA